MTSLRSASLAALVSALLAGAPVQAQTGSALPPTPPTGSTAGPIAPLAAVATPADHAGARRHRAQVTCTGGQLEVRADNSSLNGILRAVSQCTGMRITGGVIDQRVYGNYGPAAPATVLATLLDGTETNVLLKETARDQPSELILTPRTGGATPPSPSQVADDDPVDDPGNVPATPAASSNKVGEQTLAGNQSQGGGRTPGNESPQPASPALASAPGAGSGPVSIPQPINNVLGSPSNTSLNAGDYPTTHSVPLDSLPTPSTTPAQTGIVSAPNPPPAGSDTAALLNGRTTNMPADTTITDHPTATIAPGAEAVGAGTNGAAINGTGTGSAGTLTPQQVVDQLQRLRQKQANPEPAQAPPPATQPQ